MKHSKTISRSARSFALPILLVCALTGPALAVPEMVIPPVRVGSSDWGANESVNQMFSWADPVIGQPDPGLPIDTSGYAWDSGSEFNLIAWMDFGVDRTFTALDFATQNNNDGFNRVKLWISNGLSNFTVVNGSTPPAGTPDLNVTCGANGSNFARYNLTTNVTARYVVAQFLSERITSTVKYHPRAWELRMEALPLAAATDYQVWIAGYSLAGGDAAPDFDYDKDGLANGIEYVLGTDPKAGTRSPLTPTVSGADVKFTFERAVRSKQTNVSLAIETSPNMTSWPNVYTIPDSTAAPVQVVPNGATETITLTLPRAAETAKFARLKVLITL